MITYLHLFGYYRFVISFFPTWDVVFMKNLPNYKLRVHTAKTSCCHVFCFNIMLWIFQIHNLKIFFQILLTNTSSYVIYCVMKPFWFIISGLPILYALKIVLLKTVLKYMNELSKLWILCFFVFLLFIDMKLLVSGNIYYFIRAAI